MFPLPFLSKTLFPGNRTETNEFSEVGATRNSNCVSAVEEIVRRFPATPPVTFKSSSENLKFGFEKKMVTGIGFGVALGLEAVDDSNTCGLSES